MLLEASRRTTIFEFGNNKKGAIIVSLFFSCLSHFHDSAGRLTLLARGFSLSPLPSAPVSFSGRSEAWIGMSSQSHKYESTFSRVRTSFFPSSSPRLPSSLLARYAHTFAFGPVATIDSPEMQAEVSHQQAVESANMKEDSQSQIPRKVRMSDERAIFF